MSAKKPFVPLPRLTCETPEKMWRFLSYWMKHYRKCRQPILSLYKGVGLKSNPYKTDRKNTSKYIDTLKTLLRFFAEEGPSNFRETNPFIMAKLELQRANRRLTLHEVYAQKYGIPRGNPQDRHWPFHMSLDYKDTVKDAAKYERVTICHCLRESGNASVLDADFMVTLAEFLPQEYDWLAADKFEPAEEDISRWI